LNKPSCNPAHPAGDVEGTDLRPRERAGAVEAPGDLHAAQRARDRDGAGELDPLVVAEGQAAEPGELQTVDVAQGQAAQRRHVDTLGVVGLDVDAAADAGAAHARRHPEEKAPREGGDHRLAVDEVGGQRRKDPDREHFPGVTPGG
jgi:hypothetical protein